jgi:hypothetical protein
MKKTIKLFLLIVIVLLSSCSKNIDRTEIPIIQDTEPSAIHTQESAPLILGGKHYVGRVGDVVVVDAIGTQDWIDDPRKCFLEDAASLLHVWFDIDPLDPNKMNSFENVEMLTNLKSLSIYGKNLDRVNFNPLSELSTLEYLSIEGEGLGSVTFSFRSALNNLEDLYIKGNLSSPPDLTSLEKLTEIVIRGSFLESFQGLGAPNVRRMTIEMETFDSMAPLSNLTELEFLDIGAPRSNLVTIGNIRNVPKLKSLFLGTGGIIDLTGIEQLTGLNDLRLDSFSTPVNTQGISGLHNLEILVMSIFEDENPSIEYLRGLPNLRSVSISSKFTLSYGKIKEPYQILDISPLGQSPKLEKIDIRGFIIKNVSALNHLENLRYNAIILDESRLLDETEAQRSTKWLIFNVSILRDG